MDRVYDNFLEPNPGAIDSNGNWYPTMPTADDVARSRKAMIDWLWVKYQRGDYTKAPVSQTAASKIELIDPNFMHVSKTYSPFTGEVINIDVASKDPDQFQDLNFFGFSPKERCIAFCGQACHYKSFSTLPEWYSLAQTLESYYKASPEVKFPDGGLQPGLSYDIFAGHVEVVKYAAWLKESPNVHEQATQAFTLMGIPQNLGLPEDPPVTEPEESNLEHQEGESLATATSPSHELVEYNQEGESEQASASSLMEVDSYSYDPEDPLPELSFTESTAMDVDCRNIRPDEDEDNHDAVCPTPANNSADSVEEQATDSAVVADASDMVVDIITEDGGSSPAVGSPWSLFGEDDDENDGVSRQSPTSPLTDLDIGSDDAPVMEATEKVPEVQSMDNKQELDTDDQVSNDAAIAAELASRYTFRRVRTRSQSVAQTVTEGLAWIESTGPSPTKRSTRAHNKSSPIKKSFAKKGTAKKIPKKIPNRR